MRTGFVKRMDHASRTATVLWDPIEAARGDAEGAPGGTEADASQQAAGGGSRSVYERDCAAARRLHAEWRESLPAPTRTDGALRVLEMVHAHVRAERPDGTDLEHASRAQRMLHHIDDLQHMHDRAQNRQRGQGGLGCEPAGQLQQALVGEEETVSAYSIQVPDTLPLLVAGCLCNAPHCLLCVHSDESRSSCCCPIAPCFTCCRFSLGAAGVCSWWASQLRQTVTQNSELAGTVS